MDIPKLKRDKDALLIAIYDSIKEIENQKGYELTTQDRAFLLTAVEKFVTQSLQKFIGGAKEHGDSSFVEEVDHKSEILNETIDLWFYGLANKIKKERKQ